jgi:lipopolysaccharide export system permease protein
MNFPFVFSRYIISKFIAGISIVLGGVGAVVLLANILEIIRRSYGKEVPFEIILKMVLFKFPFLIQEILPFIILLGTILVFSRLTSSYELVAARASGLSAWQFLIPALITSFVIGLVFVTLLNPISTALLNQFEKYDNKYLGGSGSIMSISSSGLWVKESDEKEKKIIHASRIAQANMELYDITIFVFSSKSEFIQRIDAKSALLRNNQFILSQAIINSPNEVSKKIDKYELTTSIKISQLQDSFSSAETVSIWELPRFINTLNEAGFSALKHLLRLYTLIIQPFFLSAMVLIGAAFSLRMARRGKVTMWLLFGVFAGFLIYFISNVIAAMGLSGSIPIILAAWVPVLISVFLGIFMILHLEDG